MYFMKQLSILLFPLALFASSPFESPKDHNFNLSVFNTEQKVKVEEKIHKSKIKCRYVCDKKIYKEQKIAEAVSFYKKTKLP